MLIRDVIYSCVPKSLRLRHWIRHEVRNGEPELRLVGRLLKDSGAMVDVGANAGIYSAVALQKRRWVAAFEPVPEEATRLRRLIGTRGIVHQVALSDRSGKATLHVPYVSDVAVTTRSSLEANVDADMKHRDIEVEVATLDSFALSDIAFIKIDVEGHELPVLRGAIETITRSRPNLLVEVEEFRIPGCFRAVSDFFASLDYGGFWFDGKKMRPIENFHPSAQQVNRPKFGEQRLQEYINNFIWLPHGRPGGSNTLLQHLKRQHRGRLRGRQRRPPHPRRREHVCVLGVGEHLAPVRGQERERACMTTLSQVIERSADERPDLATFFSTLPDRLRLIPPRLAVPRTRRCK